MGDERRIRAHFERGEAIELTSMAAVRRYRLATRRSGVFVGFRLRFRDRGRGRMIRISGTSEPITDINLPPPISDGMKF